MSTMDGRVSYDLKRREQMLPKKEEVPYAFWLASHSIAVKRTVVEFSVPPKAKLVEMLVARAKVDAGNL